MSPFYRLLSSAGLAHFADQVAFVALPLTAVLLLDAGPAFVGVLVALQGAAWFFVALPAGVVVDRVSRSRIIAWSQVLAAVSFCGAFAVIWKGWWTAFGALVFIGASGTVPVVLGAMALVPTLVAPERLPAANARLELVRAVTTLAAPVIVGILAEQANPALGFGLAGVVAIMAAAAGFSVRSPEPQGAARVPLVQAIREGAAFALRHDLLRGILLCAVFWNFAFFALLAVIVPFGLERLGLDVKILGVAQSGYGFGLIAGASAAGVLLARLEPRVILIIGPALSVLAAGLFLGAPVVGGATAVFVGYFLIGFGPMLWLICQTSIRQLVTPPALLGRVAALVQFAIYGVRPIGALVGGWVGAAAGLEAALVLVLVGFSLSTAVPLLSALGRLRVLPQPQPS